MEFGEGKGTTGRGCGWMGQGQRVGWSQRVGQSWGGKGPGASRGWGLCSAGPSVWWQLPWVGSTARFFCSSSRVISRAPGLKLVVETLISSLRPIGNIVLICCAFFIIFGILGVQVHSPACLWDGGLWSAAA